MITGVAQGTYIASGTFLRGNAGTTIFYSDLVNNGIYLNTSNTVIFAGASQRVGGSAPAGFDNVTIESGSTVNQIYSGFTIHGILTCNGLMNSSGNMVLLSDSLSTGLVAGTSTGQITGEVNMQRYLPSGFGYKYLSSPFQDATVGELGDDINLLSSSTAVYKYDENKTSSGWVNYKVTTNPFVPVSGYAVNVGNNLSPVTIDLKGKVNTGNISVSLYNHNHTYTRGFNLVGNPYPSPIDWDAPTGWTRTNIDNAVYYFNTSSSDQYSGTYSTYMEGISSDGIASNIIPSMQGFFVHVSDGAYPVAGTLAFTNEVRVTDKTQSFSKSGAKASPQLVRIVAGYTDNSATYDPFVIYYDEKATFSFDNQLDALKLFNTDAAVTNFYVFSDDGNRLSINALPDVKDSGCVLRLGLKTSRSGEVEFKIKDISGIYLEQTISITDVITGTTVNLSGGQSYKLTLPSGDYQNRFFLNMGNALTGTEDKIIHDSGFRAWSSQGILKTDINIEINDRSRIYIYNLSGQLLFSGSVPSSGYHEFYPGINNGVCLVTLISGNIRLTRKVVFQN